MKNTIKLLTGIILAANFLACTSQSAKAPKLKTNMDSVSYAMGVWFASGPLSGIVDKKDIDLDLLKKAIENVIAGNDTVLNRMVVESILRDYSVKQGEKQAEKEKADEELRIKEGEDFLAKNKSKAGVVETASGLQYKVIRQGSGRTPVATDMVKVNYTGRLIDGKVFDSSKDHGQPAEFVLDQVIRGWTEGLQLMNEGSVYELYVPYALGYGNRPAGEMIKPFSTLVFEVELLEILTPESAE